jgi:HlyD family secretion protein
MRSGVVRSEWWGAVLLGCLAAVLCGCSQERPKANSANAETAARKINVTVATVEERDVTRTVQIVGTLSPEEEVTLGTETFSTVSKIFVDLGDSVKAGQVVIKMDDRGARLVVEQATANLRAAQESLGRVREGLEASRANVDRARHVVEDARTTLGRLRGLFAEGAISASQRDSAQTQYDVAVASLRVSEAQYESDRAGLKNAEAGVEQARVTLEIARKALNDTSVVSPIDGVVRKRLVNVGDTFREKTPLMSLVTVGTLKLTGDVPERFAPLVRVGRPVHIEVEAYPGQTFPSTITRVSPSVDVESRSFQIEASVPNEKGLLKPGFFAKAVIVTSTDRNVPFVSEEAVVSIAGIVKVFAIVDSKAEERRVRTGIRRDGLTEILEGVKIGEVVAISNLTQLATGTAVTVQSGSRAAGNGEKPSGQNGPGKGSKGR